MQYSRNQLSSQAYKKIIFIIASLFVSVSYGHDDATASDFCPRGVIKNISTVAISGQSLVKLLQDKVVNCPVGIKGAPNDELGIYVGEMMVNNNPYAKHDVFDELARLAYSYASCVCASMVNKDVNLNSIRPLLIAPSSLVDEDHHTIYELEEGIEFSCNICVTRTIR
jgi:hypothetical protein